MNLGTMRPLTVVLLLVLGGTLFGAWFFTTHDRVTEPVWQGYRGEARFNPYFAAERLLAEFGYDTASIETWTGNEQQIAEYDTLVTRVSPELTTESRRRLAFDWLAAGGHLVLLPPLEEATARSDSFLGELGFALVTAPPDEEDDRPGDPPADAAESGPGAPSDADADADEEYDYRMELDRIHLRIAFDDEVPVSASLSDSRGYVAVRRNWGDGVVTLFADADWLSNYQLQDADNARLLLDALAGYVEPGKIWFVFDAAVPPLWQLIWRNFPLLVVCVALALLAWIASVAPSFGPVLAAESRARRSLLEHVRAAGLFAWRHDGAATLHGAAVGGVLHAAEARHPGIGRLSRADQATRLAGLTGLPAQRILEALTVSGRHRPREFTEDIRLLRQIREKL